MAATGPDHPACRFSLRLLGPFQVQVDGRPLPRLRTRKEEWLLALLALRSGAPLPRPWLAGTLWPGSSETAALACLRTALTDLRRALDTEAGRLQSPTPHSLALDLNGAFVDLLAFDAAIATRSAAKLADVVALYRGPLLEGCDEEWVFQERQRREQAFLQALERLAVAAMARGEIGEAVRYLEAAAGVDPLREDARRSLMAALAAGGNHGAALQSYRELRSLLQRELGVLPDPETEALYERIRAEAQAKAARGAAPSKGERQLARQTASRHPCREPGAGSRELRPQAAPPESGPLPPESPYYVERPHDALFAVAIARHDSIIRIKGARQMGKTSMLARGLHQAREAGDRVVITDFQRLNLAHLESAERLYVTLAGGLADQLELEVFLDQRWSPRLGPGGNFERYLRREVLAGSAAPLVWGMDEVDALGVSPIGDEVFAFFRSLHGARALDPEGPWHRLTMAMAYATEPHLFIRNLHQSPFNVGTRIVLADFSLAEVAVLNGRYGCPLCDEAEVARYATLLGGHPFLVHRGLQEIAARDLDLRAYEAQAVAEDGIYGDHLKRLVILLNSAPELVPEVRAALQGRPCASVDAFFRLRSAGILAGGSAAESRLRCPLYAAYLEKHLP
jgi:DNA-binding SARP family transcriptional activator